jgi:hypothetical protein
MTRSTTVWSMRYASARSVSEVPDTTATGRLGWLTSRETSRMSWAPAELFGWSNRSAPSAGMVSGVPAFAVTSGMFERPLDHAAVTRSFHPRNIDAEVTPDLGGDDHDADYSSLAKS